LRGPKEDTSHVPCPRCGSATNRHAEKLVFRADSIESVESTAGATRFEDEGFVEEFHTCPACHYVLERPA